MATLTQKTFSGEFIFSEANGRQSRDLVTVISGQNIKAGRVLGKITASSKYTAVAPAAGDGSQTAIAVLFADCDASGGDKANQVIMARSCELNQSELDWGALNAGQITTAIGQLAAVGIIVRPAI